MKNNAERSLKGIRASKVGRVLYGLWIRVRRFCSRIIRRINDLKLRTKMILLCILCVLIPLVGTDTIVLSLIYNAEHQRLESQMDDVSDYVLTQMENLNSSIGSMLGSVYTADAVYDFLGSHYPTQTEFMDAYRKQIEPMNLVYGNNTFVSGVTFYGDNDTLISGGGVGTLSSVRNKDWYKSYKRSDRGMTTYAYYDRGQKSRCVSVIRKLDYAKKSGGKTERLVKLDISYPYYSQLLSQEYFNADVYICSNGLILFSNTDPSTRRKPFRTVSEIDVSAAARTIGYKMYDADWKIYLFHSDESKRLTVSSVVADNWALLLLLVIINLVIPFASIFFITRSITGRLLTLGEHLKMVKDERFEEIAIRTAKDELGELIENYNLMSFKIKELIEDVYKEELIRQKNELQKREAQLRALHSQINPHFMFNALESIRMRSLVKNEKETAEVIEQLAIMMRKTTDWCDDLVTVRDEFDFAETYLKLQQYRFGDRLSYKINLEPECMDCLIPKLSLVTFVENACVHGVEGIKRSSIIILSAQRDGDRIRIFVEDTGAGMSEEQSKTILDDMRNITFELLNKRRSVGIVNACLRLRSCFKGDAEFDLDSEEGVGTCITISIPIRSLR